MPQLTEPSSCSAESRACAEPLAASAPDGVKTWVVVEDPGRWASKAVEDTELPPAVRDVLLQAKTTPGWRPALVRPSDQGGPGMRVWLARCTPGEAALFRWDLDAPDDIVDLPLKQVAGGAEGPRCEEPLVLVCVHGQRDRCCALLGAPVHRALAAVPGIDARRSTHLGGHRFAATAIALPLGVMYGRLAPEDAEPLAASLRDGTIFDLDRYRGACAWPRHIQAALHAHVRSTGQRRLDDIQVLGSIRLSEGRWRVALTAAQSGPAYCEYEVWRANTGAETHKSCADAAPSPVSRWETRKVG